MTDALRDDINGAEPFRPWDYTGGPRVARARSLPALRFVDPSTLGAEPIPARRWIVDGWLPVGTVTLLTGDGGLGKSLLALQLATACATGTQWLGLEVEQCRAILIAAEDDEAELRRRQVAINTALGIDFSGLADLRWSSRVGQDNLLMVERRGDGLAMEPLFDKIALEAEGFGPGLLILDSLHDFFAGNENSRPQVRFFVQNLTRLARDLDAAVLLLAHPSVAGLNSGSGTSGSTAWHNSVRSRLYLTAPQTAADEDGRDFRELKTMKANYAAAGGSIRMRWENGVFVRDDGHKAPATMVDRIAFDGRALEEMRTMIAEGSELPSDQFARNAFVNVLRKRDGFRQIGQSAAIACQRRLIETGKAVVITMGPPSKQRTYIRPADVLYAREGRGRKGEKQ